MEKRLLLIINPVAGIRKRKNILWEIVSDFCEKGYECTTQITTPKIGAKAIVEKYGHNKDMIVCVGGDGTFNETVSGCMSIGIKPILGYIPAGTTNDFANSIGLPLFPMQAVRALENEEIVTIDVGKFNDRVFTYTASFGIFTKASYDTPREMKHAFGYLAYLLSGAKELGDIKSHHVKLKAEGRVIEGNYIFGGICNSKRVGGVVNLPDDIVDMNDGLLEVFLIKMPNNGNEFMQLIFDLNTENYQSNMIEFFSTHELDIEAEETMDWTIDGEYQKGQKQIHIENVKDAIKICI